MSHDVISSSCGTPLHFLLLDQTKFLTHRLNWIWHFGCSRWSKIHTKFSNQILVISSMKPVKS